MGNSRDLLLLPPEVLLANILSSLESLTLRHVSLNLGEQETNHFLARCRASLTRLTLQRVALLSPAYEQNDDDDDSGVWGRVGKLLLTMPKLEFVELQMVYARDEVAEPLGYWSEVVTTLEGGDPPGKRLEGRDSVVEGLRKLSRQGVDFFGYTLEQALHVL